MHNSYHSTTQHNHTSPKVGLSLSYIKLFLIFSKNENWWRYNTFRAYYLFFYLRNLFRICYLATSMVVEGANQYGANQYIFLKQLRFIIYMRLGDIVYQPWVETLLSTLAAPQNLYFVELTCWIRVLNATFLVVLLYYSFYENIFYNWLIIHIGCMDSVL